MEVRVGVVVGVGLRSGYSIINTCLTHSSSNCWESIEPAST